MKDLIFTIAVIAFMVLLTSCSDKEADVIRGPVCYVEYYYEGSYYTTAAGVLPHDQEVERSMEIISNHYKAEPIVLDEVPYEQTEDGYHTKYTVKYRLAYSPDDDPPKPFANPDDTKTECADEIIGND